MNFYEIHFTSPDVRVFVEGFVRALEVIDEVDIGEPELSWIEDGAWDALNPVTGDLVARIFRRGA